jgi:hypothetical protein
MNGFVTLAADLVVAASGEIDYDELRGIESTELRLF